MGARRALRHVKVHSRFDGKDIVHVGIVVRCDLQMVVYFIKYVPSAFFNPSNTLFHGDRFP